MHLHLELSPDHVHMRGVGDASLVNALSSFLSVIINRGGARRTDRLVFVVGGSKRLRLRFDSLKSLVTLALMSG